jgi:hypothetical protein
MRLFGRKKEEVEEEQGGIIGLDPTTDEGIVGLYYSIIGRIKADFQNATISHLERLHEPGGYAREKSAHDFMDLGMDRSYIDALDDLEFTVEDAVTVPQLPLKRRGTAVIVSRWTARGRYNRPGVPGVEPNGKEVTIEGMTYTSFRNFNIRLEYTFWHMAEFTGRMAER